MERGRSCSQMAKGVGARNVAVAREAMGRMQVMGGDEKRCVCRIEPGNVSDVAFSFLSRARGVGSVGLRAGSAKDVESFR